MGHVLIPLSISSEAAGAEFPVDAPLQIAGWRIAPLGASGGEGQDRVSAQDAALVFLSARVASRSHVGRSRSPCSPVRP